MQAYSPLRLNSLGKLSTGPYDTYVCGGVCDKLYLQACLLDGYEVVD